MEESQNYWRKCSTCKKEIGFHTIYQVCNVSTCKKWVYCSVDCWNMHNPVMNHKSSWAEEMRSPRKENVVVENSTATAPRRILVQNRPASSGASANEEEILIVASKLKQYIKDKYDMNTSGNVMEILSQQVRRITDRAVEKARSEGRKTVMDRDYE